MLQKVINVYFCWKGLFGRHRTLPKLEEDVNHRIRAGGSKYRNASRVLCDCRIPIKLKRKFYKTIIRPSMLYDAECWVVKKHIHK